ncbi:cob(I)yrinic acid a,c-diamide adenosyltransferase [Planctomicrobium sp. SH664]|uniref:cob(I)yrinic acid a,c-diamide adenosyltransferase n=1 Tax=Planctomicrobium sp. SH664 TaxID=3448125 RepID=UPI003F5CBA4F
MVYLNRIYTRSGDAGETSLGNGDRVPKTHPRIAAYGDVDELNASLGVAIALGNLDDAAVTRLREIQNDLFDVGADLCVPESAEETAFPPLRVQPAQPFKLERWIDVDVEQLQPLNSFILPGGTAGAALLHQSRTICRRAEISVLKLVEQEPVNQHVAIYLNRLSDLLFVMARMANDGGRSEILWTPGSGRS